jgi:hypothetical protein
LTRELNCQTFEAMAKENTPHYIIQILKDDIFDFPVVAIPCRDNSPDELVAAIKQWRDLLCNSKGMKNLLSYQVFEKTRWFGFGIKIGNTIYSEQNIFSETKASDELTKVTSDFIQHLTNYNKTNLPLEGLYTHEELETGTYAVRWLLLNELKYQTLYIKYLDSIDLDHTVEQHTTISLLYKKYGPDNIRPLTNFMKNYL